MCCYGASSHPTSEMCRHAFPCGLQKPIFEFSFYIDVHTSVFSCVYLQLDSFQPLSPNRVGGVGMHSHFSTMDDPMSQMMRGPPMGVRDVVIIRPTSKKSFGFVMQSNTKRQGCSICEKVKSTG